MAPAHFLTCSEPVFAPAGSKPAPWFSCLVQKHNGLGSVSKNGAKAQCAGLQTQGLSWTGLWSIPNRDLPPRLWQLPHTPAHPSPTGHQLRIPRAEACWSHTLPFGEKRLHLQNTASKNLAGHNAQEDPEP